MQKIVPADEYELAHCVFHRGKVIKLTDRTSKVCGAVVGFLNPYLEDTLQKESGKLKLRLKTRAWRKAWSQTESWARITSQIVTGSAIIGFTNASQRLKEKSRVLDMLFCDIAKHNSGRDSETLD